MWFKNLRIFRLTGPTDLSVDALEPALASRGFRPCAGEELESLGWDAPLGREGAPLVQAANGCLLVCARREEKVLPPAVVRERLEERAAEIEGRSPGRRARGRLREEIIQELLPQAFSRSRRIFAYLDPERGWAVVDSASARRAEELMSLLRESLGTLPARPLAARSSQSAVMTAWLLGRADSGPFGPDDACELRDPSSEGAVVRCRRQDLGSGEVRGHLEAGKQVRRLSVSWHDRLSCSLEEDLAVKQLRFSDVLVEEAAEAAGEDPAARLDADFALMTLELRAFIPSLLDAFDGEAQEAGNSRT